MKLRFKSSLELALGSPIPVLNHDDMKSGSAIWSGYTRVVSVTTWWVQTTPARLLLEAKEIKIGKCLLPIPEGHRILALGLRSNFYSKGKIIAKRGTVRILTRPPTNLFEKKLSSSWPVVHPTWPSKLTSTSYYSWGQLTLL